MRKTIFLLLVALALFSVVGCGSDKLDIGIKEGIAYFECSRSMPQIILGGESETVIEDEAFLDALISAIDGKAAVEDMCNCEALYNIRIDKYNIGLHTHGISVTYPIGHNIKGLNVFTVDCTDEEMNALFEILTAVTNYTQS